MIDYDTRDTVPCELCGKPASFTTAAKRCIHCWALERGILMAPRLARRILARMPAPPMPDFTYRWGWDVSFLGWRRCLTWTLAIDVYQPLVGLVLFGLMISWGRHLDLPTLTTTTTEVASEPD